MFRLMLTSLILLSSIKSFAEPIIVDCSSNEIIPDFIVSTRSLLIEQAQTQGFTEVIVSGQSDDCDTVFDNFLYSATSNGIVLDIKLFELSNGATLLISNFTDVEISGQLKIGDGARLKLSRFRSFTIKEEATLVEIKGEIEVYSNRGEEPQFINQNQNMNFINNGVYFSYETVEGYFPIFLENIGQIFVDQPTNQQNFSFILNRNQFNIDLSNQVGFEAASPFIMDVFLNLNKINIIGSESFSGDDVVFRSENATFGGEVNLDSNTSVSLIGGTVEDLLFSGDGFFNVGESQVLQIAGSQVSFHNIKFNCSNQEQEMCGLSLSGMGNESTVHITGLLETSGNFNISGLQIEFMEGSTIELNSTVLNLDHSSAINYSREFRAQGDESIIKSLNGSYLDNQGIIYIDSVKNYYQEGWRILNNNEINIAPTSYLTIDNYFSGQYLVSNGELNIFYNPELLPSEISIKDATINGNINIEGPSHLKLMGDRVLLRGIYSETAELFVDSAIFIAEEGGAIYSLVAGSEGRGDIAFESTGDFRVFESLVVNSSLFLDFDSPQEGEVVDFILEDGAIGQVNDDIHLLSGSFKNFAGNRDNDGQPESYIAFSENASVLNSTDEGLGHNNILEGGPVANLDENPRFINHGITISTVKSDFTAWSIENHGEFILMVDDSEGGASDTVFSGQSSWSDDGVYSIKSEFGLIGEPTENRVYFLRNFLNETTIEIQGVLLSSILIDEAISNYLIKGIGFIDGFSTPSHIAPSGGDGAGVGLLYWFEYLIIGESSTLNIDVYDEINHDHVVSDSEVQVLGEIILHFDEHFSPQYQQHFTVAEANSVVLAETARVSSNRDDRDVELELSVGDGEGGQTLEVTVVDTIPPYALSAQPTDRDGAQRLFGIGDSLDLSLSFSEPVTIIPGSDAGCSLGVELDDGALEIMNPFEAIDLPLGDLISLVYVIEEGDEAQSLAALRFISQGCEITDVAGHALSSMSPLEALEPLAEFRIDGVRPTFERLSIPTGDDPIRVEDTLTAILEFSEPVSLPAPLRLRFNSGDVATFAPTASKSTARRVTAEWTLTAFPENGVLIVEALEHEGLPLDEAGNEALDPQDISAQLMVEATEAGDDILFDDQVPELITGEATAATALLGEGQRAEIVLNFNGPLSLDALQLHLSSGGVADMHVSEDPNQLEGTYTVALNEASEGLTIVGYDGGLFGSNNLLAVDLSILEGFSLAGSDALRVDGVRPTLRAIRPVGLVTTAGEALLPNPEQTEVNLELAFNEPIFLEAGVLRVTLNTHTGEDEDEPLHLSAEAETQRGSDTRADLARLHLPYEPMDDLDEPLLRVLSVQLEPGGVLVDEAGNPIDLPIPLDALDQPLAEARLHVDTRRPKITKIDAGETAQVLAEGDRLTIKVTFDEPVYLEGRLELELNNRRILTKSASSGGASPEAFSVAEFGYTVRSGEGIDDLQVARLEVMEGQLTDKGLRNHADLNFDGLNISEEIDVLGEDDWRYEGVVGEDAAVDAEVTQDAARTVLDAGTPDMDPDDPRRGGAGYGADAELGAHDEDASGCSAAGRGVSNRSLLWLGFFICALSIRRRSVASRPPDLKLK